MSRILRASLVLAGLVSMSGSFAPNAAAQPSGTGPGGGNLYVVTHVDIAATAGKLAEATELVRQYAEDSRKDPGIVRFDLVQLDGHPNHFLFYEIWQTRKAFDTHLKAEHTRRFREKLQPMLGSPFRERLHTRLP